MSALSARNAPTQKARTLRGFTLIELLVVIALTTLLMTLIFKPLVDSYNLTSRASVIIDTQVNARDTMRNVETILSNAVFVYDNMQTPINIWLPRNDGFNLSPDQPNPNQGFVRSRFSMVEYVLPARQLDQRPGGIEIDPTTGNPIYGPGSTPGQRGYALPLAPGRALGRIFIGLVNNRSVTDGHVIDNNFPNDARQNGMPFVSYGNWFEDPQLNSRQDNRYTLWKAEVLAYIPDPDDANNPTPRYVPNLGLFHTLDANRQIVDTKNGALQLHDPNFFYDNSNAGGDGNRKWAVPGWRDINGDGLVQIWENWRAVSTSQMPLNRVDMISLDRADNSNAIVYYDGSGKTTTDGSGRPQMRPLTTFTPASVQNDLAAAGATNNAGNDAPGAPPTVFRSQYTHWSTPYRVLIYRADPTNPASEPLARSPLQVYLTDGSGKIGKASLAPNASLPDVSSLQDVGPMFDATGHFTNPNAEFAFLTDPLRGTVNFEIPSSAILRDPNNNPVPARFSPFEVNASYFDTIPNSGVQVEKRYIDLRVLPQTTWNATPLNPGLISPIAQNRPWYQTVRVVPGTERVVGPDQTPGSNYGYPVLYRRISANAGFIGKNEYKILYSDVSNANPAGQFDPRVRVGFIEFNSLPDSAGQYNLLDAPDTSRDGDQIAEDPAGQWGKGVIYRPNGIPHLRVNRQTGQNELVAPIEVTFSFQMNQPKDVVKVDYMTREMMNIALEVRLYEPRTNAAQGTSLTSKVRVRNLMR